MKYIKFCVKTVIKYAGTFGMPTVAFDESIISRTKVQLWYNGFNECLEDNNDKIRPDCPITSTTDENIETKMILDNGQNTFREVANDVAISFGSC